MICKHHLPAESCPICHMEKVLSLLEDKDTTSLLEVEEYEG